MPFTLAHPAAVLPLRRTGLPMAALVCGSMAPDLHMLVPGLSGEATHAWSAIVVLALPLGLALTAAWVMLLGPTVRAALPDAVRARLPRGRRWSPTTWALAVPASLVGAATHLGWDSFTHVDMWGGEHIAWLHELHHGRPGAAWSQYASSLFGLAVLAAFGWIRLRRNPVRVVPPASRGARRALLVPLVLAVLAAAALDVLLLLAGWRGGDALVTAALRLVLSLGLLGALVGASLWRSLDPAGARAARDS